MAADQTPTPTVHFQTTNNRLPVGEPLPALTMSAQDATRPEMRETDGERADRELYEWLCEQSR